MATINYLTTINFAEGAVASLSAELLRLGISRPLLVTDAGVRAAGLLDALPAEARRTVYDGTPSNPTEAAIRDAVAILRAEGCDGLVAVGGGSAIDLAKGVAIAATHDGPLAQYALVEGGLQRITPATLPVVAVPTTAGTGAEVGRAAVIILDDGRKLGLISPHVIPKLAICDPEMTYGLPPILTAATGMDALAHCFETFMASSYNPPADAIALDGLRRGWKHIETATRSPRDREARRNMMSASLQGALAFQKGLGCVHSLSHAIGGLHPRLHHGTLNAVLLPVVIRFNAGAPGMREEDKIARMALATGIGASADELAAATADLTVRLGLPSRLSALDLGEDDFAAIVERALGDHCHATNPRTASREDYLAMLRESL